MKKILISLIFFSHITLSYDLNSISKQKPVWQNFPIDLNHQVSLIVGFGNVNAYLCLFNSTEYKNFSNLKTTDGSSMGYMAKLDENSCGQVNITLPWAIKSEQASSDAPLVIEMKNDQCILGNLNNCVTGIQTRLSLTKQDSVTNPYGVLTFDYNYGTRPNSEPLYLATYESKEVDNKVEFKSAIFVDSNLIFPTNNIGTASEFYSSTIIHTPNSGGEGTVTTLNFYGGSNFPDDTPNFIRTTNFVYNADNILYRDIDQTGNATDDRCISRKDKWTYVPAWFGYGIYDINGDRLVGNPNISVNYSGPVATSGETFNGTIVLSSASSIGMTYVCKKVKDGTHYNGTDMCPGIPAGQPHTPVILNGEVYENFPLMDIPDGTVVKDSSDNEYYIRVLRPRTVYAEAPLSECASMTIGLAKNTPDHTFLNYLELDYPRVGAVLVNRLENNPTKDVAFNGRKWIATDDSDGDGVINSLDLYPLDPNKHTDVDFDGVEDSEDSDISAFKFNWVKHLEKTMFSAYEKNKQN